MEGIKVGEYVRVTNYENKTAIGKVTEVKEDSYIVDTQKKETSGEYGKCCEVKHSTNIIDLIEVNDIVKYFAYDEIVIAPADKIDIKYKFKNIADDIKILKVITHEQFEEQSFEV